MDQCNKKKAYAEKKRWWEEVTSDEMNFFSLIIYIYEFIVNVSFYE